MAFVSTTYKQDPGAPIGKWTCAPGSKKGPFDSAPSGDDTKKPLYCGQCVSYVKQVCPNLPATSQWKKGLPVKGDLTIQEGTVIATFNSSGTYEGHAAIYVSQNKDGITVYDQWVTPPSPKPVGQRVLGWNDDGNSDNGNNFFVVEPL